MERVIGRGLEEAEGIGRPLSSRTRQRQRSVEAYLKGGAAPRWMQRIGDIDRGIAMQERYLGHGNAVGATYYWTGNDAVGAGRATLLGADAAKVEVEVETSKPAKALSDYEFALAPDGNGTRVTWTISGEKDASGKAFGFFAVPLDEMGSDMEKALASLGSAIEADSKLATK